ncbi:hypothetical protein OIU74_006709 [Salix koriyanagi]|uniref:Uncharacterized protein n=1 Tax=Salix koriyanagi TaxID=2511006 RepID=A0A9Q0ZBT1_9ROSI|nr:hypothetical protein OIU74_006709 [Salix koriyanagi]
MNRPSMLAVVFMLSNETEIPSPKQPAFLFRESRNNPDVALAVEDGNLSPYWRGGPWNGHTLSGLPDVGNRLKYNDNDYSKEIDLFIYSFENNQNESSVSFSARNGTVPSILVLEPRNGATADLCTCLPGFKAFYRHDWYMYCEELLPVEKTCQKGKQYTEEGQDFYLRVEAGELAAYAKNSSKSSTATNWIVKSYHLFAIALLLLFVSIYLHSRKKRAVRKGKKS